jgi:hypothetical protein
MPSIAAAIARPSASAGVIELLRLRPPANDAEHLTVIFCNLHHFSIVQ